MEKFIIEQLGGANRNRVEGVGNSPDVVKGWSFKRGGGYVPLGGINENWLEERSFSKVTHENEDLILLEGNDVLVSQWRPSVGDLGESDFVTYDEADFTLLSRSVVWLNNRLKTLEGDLFRNETDLALVPSTGVLAPWRRTHDNFVGGSWYITLDGDFTNGESAGIASFTEESGTGLFAGIYEFFWLVETPTVAGLLSRAFGRAQHTVSSSSEISGLRISLSETYPEGSTVRFYYRPVDKNGLVYSYQQAIPLPPATFSGNKFIQSSTISQLATALYEVDEAQKRDPRKQPRLLSFQSATVERFSVVVSDGRTPPEAKLGEPGTDWFPSGDALLTFGSNRTELHNGRTWGVAAPQSMIPLVPDSALTRGGGFMFFAGSNIFEDEEQKTEVASGVSILKAANDFVSLSIPKYKVRRTRTDIPVVVPLFRTYDTADPARSLWMYIEYLPDSGQPFLRARFSPDGEDEFALMDYELRLSDVALQQRQNFERRGQNITLEYELQDVIGEPDNTFISLNRVRIAGGDPPLEIEDTFSFANTDLNSFSAWSSYAEAYDTTIRLNAFPRSFEFPFSLGLRELQVEDVSFGNGSAVLARANIQDYDPTVNELEWTSSSDTGEVWTTSRSNNMIVRYQPAEAGVAAQAEFDTDITLVYSNVGTVNRGTLQNFLPLLPATSTQITGLASTPAGLLAFMENETFLIRGDPATGNLQTQRYSGTLGNDINTIPGRLGSVVFPIYKGEIYALNLGGGDVDFSSGIANISRPVFRPDDPFVQVVGENVRNHIVAITQSGRAYRYDSQTQAWLNDVFDEQEGLRWLSAACLCNRYGTRYNVDGFFDVVDSSLGGEPEIAWESLDLGDKNRLKLWRRVELYTEGVGDGSPRMEFVVRGESGSVEGIHQGGGRWVFTFPRGVVGPTATLRFKFPGATPNLVVEPPVVIDYAVRYRER